MFNMGSGSTNFMGESTRHLLSTEIFPDLIYSYIRGDKKNKNSKPLTRINSTESFTMDMVLKFLPESTHELNILQKNYRAL